METESKILTRSFAATGLPGETTTRLESLLSPVDLGSWFAVIDESPYTLDDWIRAMASFDTWLEEQEIDDRPVDSMIGYLECCTLSIMGNLPLPDFPDLARENLDNYGFDATRPARTDPDDDGAV